MREKKLLLFNDLNTELGKYLRLLYGEVVLPLKENGEKIRREYMQ